MTDGLAPMLERRRIEAEILSHVYETVTALHGIDEARRIVADSVRRYQDGVRKSLIINYVTNEWRAREQLAFPDRPVA